MAPVLSLLDPTVWLDVWLPLNPTSVFAHQNQPIITFKVVLPTLAGIGGHYLMPDSREGGRDTGVGRSSSI